MRETGPVVGGLAVIALSGYAVLAMVGRVLAPADYAAVASLYLLVSVLGPGVFVAVEQQTTRDVAARVAAGQGWGSVPGAAALAGVRLALLITVGVVALSPVLVPRVFGGSWLLLAGLLVAVWGAAAGYPLRGVFAGTRRFGWYGACMGIEGVARTAACVGLIWAGSVWGGSVSAGVPGPASDRVGTGRDAAVWAGPGAGWFGMVFGVGLVLAAAVTVFGPRAGGDGPPTDPRRMTARVGLLAGAGALTLVVANLAPVVLTSRLGAEGAAVAAGFVSLFVLARIPVLLVTPAQAMLLPRLAAAVERGEPDRVRRHVRWGLLVLGAAAVPAIVIWMLVGPWAAEAFLAAPVRLSPLVTALLGVGTVVMVAAQLVSPALVALGHNRSITTAWAVGVAVFAALLAGPGMPLAWAVAAQVAAPVVVLVVMLRALYRPGAATRTEPADATGLSAPGGSS